MDAKLAKQDIRNFEKAGSFGDYDGYASVVAARAYLMALEGPEMKALVGALELIAYGEPHGDNTDDLPGIAGRALALYKEAIRCCAVCKGNHPLCYECRGKE